MNNQMPGGSEFQNFSAANPGLDVGASCRGDCFESARRALDGANIAAGPLGQEKNDLSKRFQFLLDVAGGDRHKQAEIYLEHSLALYEAMYGQQHPSVARLLLALGELYTAHGDRDSAEYVIDWANEILSRPQPELEHDFFYLVGLNGAEPNLESDPERF